MIFLKIGLLTFFTALFIFACSTAKTTTNTTNNSTTAANSTNTAPINMNTLPSTPADELASSRKIYSEVCAKCHKDNGTGGPTVIDGRTIKAPDFTSEKLKSDFDEADWIDVITNGEGNKMPAFGKKFNEAEIKNLIKLIRKDFQGK
ncbi:MAG: cytochrome c [Actinomycetota bacterium]